MKKDAFLILVILCFLSFAQRCFSQPQALDSGWHHLRNTGAREWSEFPRDAKDSTLVVSFSSLGNASEKTLSLRQYDVKQDWRVLLNSKDIGTLVVDEKDRVSYLKIPAGILQAENTNEVLCRSEQVDDIMLGEIALHHKPLDSILSEGRVTIAVYDEETGVRAHVE